MLSLLCDQVRLSLSLYAEAPFEMRPLMSPSRQRYREKRYEDFIEMLLSPS